MAESKPVKMKKALSDPKWRYAMKEKLESIEKNNNRKLVDLSDGKKPIGVRWMFRVKANPKGKIFKHKAQLVIKAFLQREDLEFEEVFTPIAGIETIRLVGGITNNNN